MSTIEITKKYKRNDGTELNRNYTGVNPNASKAQIKAFFDALDSLSENSKQKTIRVEKTQID